MKTVLFFAALLATQSNLLAQMTERIETDRPDQTESPFLVPLHYLQGEFGFNRMEYDGNIQQFYHPTMLMKYGWTNRVELRLEATPYTELTREIPASKKAIKLEPLEVGTKIRFWEERGWLPKTSLIAHLGLPFAASKEYRSVPVTFSALLTLQNTLSSVIGLGYNLGVEKNMDGVTSAFYTISPGFNLGKRWYAYAEAFGSFFQRTSEHNLDGGFAYYLSPSTKLDLSGGFGLGSSLLKNYVALGFSFRLPIR